jgi:hypothetical protein
MIASWLLNPNIGRAMMPKGTVGELAQEPGHDFPIVFANSPRVLLSDEWHSP